MAQQNRLNELIREVTQGFDIELKDIKLKGYGKRKLLRITIDKKEGVTLNDCEKVSRELNTLLDADDLIQGSYTLEVTSPGIDRPLTGINDFEKNTGKLLKITTKGKINNKNLFFGRLIEVSDKEIILKINKKPLEISFDNILKARLEIEIK